MMCSQMKHLCCISMNNTPLFISFICLRSLSEVKSFAIIQWNCYCTVKCSFHCAECFLILFAKFCFCLVEHVSHIIWSIKHGVYTPLMDRTSKFYFQKMWNDNELAIIWINPGSVCWNYYCLLFCKWDGS